MKLGELAELVNGYAFKSQNYVDSGLRVIRICNVQDGFVSDENPCFYPIEFKTNLKKANLEENDLLMSLTGNVGRVALLSKEYLPAGLNQRVECIRPFNKNNTEYLYYYFRSPSFKNQVNSATTGLAQQNLSIKWLENHNIPCYEPSQQKKIVKELKNIDKGIRVKEEQLKTLDELIQSRFTEMFGNTTKNIIRKPLSVVCPIQAFDGAVESVDGKYWLLNLDAIESHTGYVLQEMYTSEIGSSTIKFSKDNVLYSKLRPYLNKVVIPNKSGFATSELVPFAPTKEINKYYFAYFLRSKAFVDYINANTNGARMPRASMDILKNFLIPVPPLPLQNQFAEFVQKVEKAKEIVKIQIDDLRELLALKMDEYFR